MDGEPGLTAVEAAQILGVHPGSIPRMIRNGVLPKRQHRGLRRQEVERVALERWAPGHPYWLGATEAAELLGVTPTRVRRLALTDKLPHVPPLRPDPVPSAPARSRRPRPHRDLAAQPRGRRLTASDVDHRDDPIRVGLDTRRGRLHGWLEAPGDRRFPITRLPGRMAWSRVIAPRMGVSNAVTSATGSHR
jgi:hypothetical protein